ncbi:EVA1C protein, partial [Penelope pileata]|nr:EVA1C protein [Penelope pileata]
FAGYISQVLKNYTDHACDGEYVSLRCPHRTTISIQSSFYGRIVPSHQMCPSRYPHSYATLVKEDVACSVGTSLQKMLDECQDRRSCQFLVNSRLFGADPCPGTGKYLLVWYKCRPNEYKSKVACEDDKLRLSCKKSMVIAIYSAIFGRTQGGSLECPYQNLGMPMIECQSTTALQLMIKRCHGKRSCSIYASTYEFGDPCYPGIRKHLNVIYTCGRSATFYPLDNTPFLLPVDETQPPVFTSSMEPVGVSTEMALLSNILAAYAFITGRP